MFGCVSTNVAFLAGVVVAASFHCVLLDEDLGCSLWAGIWCQRWRRSPAWRHRLAWLSLSLGSCCELRLQSWCPFPASFRCFRLWRLFCASVISYMLFPLVVLVFVVGSCSYIWVFLARLRSARPAGLTWARPTHEPYSTGVVRDLEAREKNVWFEPDLKGCF
jgi:hypothetical protein